MPEQLELLPTQTPAPALPKRPSNAFTLLETIVQIGQIDQPKWSAMGMGWRLAAAVYDLNQLGWCIESRLVPADFFAAGSCRPIATYSLPVHLRRVASQALKGRK